MQKQRSADALRLAVSAMFAVLLLLLVSIPLHAAPRTVQIAVLSDRDWVLEPIDDVLRSEISALLEGEFEVRFPSGMQTQAEGSLGRSRQLLEQLLQDPNVDMIVALGPLATQALAAQRSLSKPCFGTIVIDPALQGFPLTARGTTGRRNLALSVESSDLLEVIEEFRRLTPIESAAFFIDGGLIEELPAIATRLREFESRVGFRIALSLGRRLLRRASTRFQKTSTARSSVLFSGTTKMRSGDFQML